MRIELPGESAPRAVLILKQKRNLKPLLIQIAYASAMILMLMVFSMKMRSSRSRSGDLNPRRDPAALGHVSKGRKQKGVTTFVWRLD